MTANAGHTKAAPVVWMRAVRDPLADAFVIAAVAFVVGVGLGFVPVGSDYVAYWLVRDGIHYGTAPGAGPGFMYSPAIGQALTPLLLLPFPVFAAVLAAASLACLRWLGGRWAAVMLLAPFVAFELFAGNIHLLLAAAIVAGMRWPALWAFPLLTKVTPGVGLLWFAVRREWAHLGIALAATLAIVGVSVMLAPDQWFAWVGHLASSSQPGGGATFIPIPLLFRLPVAIVLVVWGARTDRVWTVPVAAMLALPVLWVGGLAMLVAVSRARAGRSPATAR